MVNQCRWGLLSHGYWLFDRFCFKYWQSSDEVEVFWPLGVPLCEDFAGVNECISLSVDIFFPERSWSMFICLKLRWANSTVNPNTKELLVLFLFLIQMSGWWMGFENKETQFSTMKSGHLSMSSTKNTRIISKMNCDCLGWSLCWAN